MMERLFQHPTWLKIFSVALAILMWAMVMQTYAAQTTKTFEVPLSVAMHPAYDLVDGPKDHEISITVTASGKGLVINRLKASDFHASVDYGKVMEPGKPTVLDVVVEGPDRVDFSYSPRTVSVTLVEVREVTVPVTLEATTGIVTKDGKEYRWTARLEKSQAQVRGRNDLLSTVRSARVSLDKSELDPAKTQVQKTVVPLDAAGKSVDKLTGSKVTVSLTWQELPPGKLFNVEPVTTGDLAPGFVIESMEVDPNQVTVRATELGGSLPDREVVETTPIDLTGKNKTFTTTVSLVAPAGTTISGAETVTVKVNIVEETVEKIFKAIPLGKQGNPAESGAVVLLAVNEVQVKVTGPSSLVTALDASSISAYVDVEGLHQGKTTLPVKVNLPKGMTGVTIDPDSVEVTVSAPVTP